MKDTIRLYPAWSPRAFNIGVVTGAFGGALIFPALFKFVGWMVGTTVVCQIVPL